MNIGIFTIVKNEQEYLKEWLDYHLSAFLELKHIYVFDDPFSESHKDICDQFQNVESANILDFFSPYRRTCILNKSDYRNSKLPIQTTFMYRVLDHLKNNTALDWVFYIDVDEFLTLQEQQPLTDILALFNSYDILSIQCKNYGASGHIYKPSTSVLESYTIPCPLLSDRFATTKLCFNLHRWDSDKIKTSHHVSHRARWCKTNFSTDVHETVYDKLYIRHYITKSFEEFAQKIFIRGQFFGSKTLNSFFAFNKDLSLKDPEIQKILSMYKKRFYSGELSIHVR